MFLTINWDKDLSCQYYKQFYTHLMCFKECLAPGIPLYIEWVGEDWGYPDDEEAQPFEWIEQSAANDSNEEALAYQCSFCGRGIASSTVDVTGLVVAINWDKEKEKQHDQQFFVHLECFQKVMHPDLKPSEETCR